MLSIPRLSFLALALVLGACGGGSHGAHDAGARMHESSAHEDAGSAGSVHVPPPHHGSGGRVALEQRDAGSDAGTLNDSDAGSDAGTLEQLDAGSDAGTPFVCVTHPADVTQDCGHGVHAQSCAACPDWAHPGCVCKSPDPSFPNQCSCQCNDGARTASCNAVAATCTLDTTTACGAL